MQWENACAGATIGVLDTFQVRPSSAPSVSHCAFVRVRVCVCVCVHVVAAKVVDSVDHSPLWSGNVISYTEEGDSKRLLQSICAMSGLLFVSLSARSSRATADN